MNKSLILNSLIEKKPFLHSHKRHFDKTVDNMIQLIDTSPSGYKFHLFVLYSDLPNCRKSRFAQDIAHRLSCHCNAVKPKGYKNMTVIFTKYP